MNGLLDDETRADIDLIDGLHVGSPPIQQQPFMPPAFSDSEDKSAHFQYILNVGVKMADTDNGQAHDIFSRFFFPNKYESTKFFYQRLCTIYFDFLKGSKLRKKCIF